MTHNPYAAPKADLGAPVEQAPIGRRPLSVGIAVLLLALGLLYGASGFIRLLGHYQTHFVTPVFMIWSLAKWLLVGLTCVQLWRGRNWARTLLAGLTALGLLTIAAQVWSLRHMPAGVDLALGTIALASMLISPLINLAAVFLVYVPGRAWFRRR